MSTQDPYRRDPADPTRPSQPTEPSRTAQSPYPPGPPGAPAGYGQPGYGTGQGYPYGGYGAYGPYGYSPVRGSNGLGVTGLVLGILSLLLFWAAAGIWLGIPAIIFGALGRGRAARGEAGGGGISVAGIVCGAIALILTIAFFVSLFAVHAAGGTSATFVG